MTNKYQGLTTLLRAGGGDLAGERMERWSAAFEDWLAERRMRFNLRVQKDAYQAWQELLAFTGKPPWEATAGDVEAYIESLVERGLSPWTQARRLTGLSEFYRYCQGKEVDPEVGGSFNPVREARHPKVIPYEKANYLSKKEEAMLLETVRRDTSTLGKRDYALILALLKTGKKATEVRRLTWGKFKEDTSVPRSLRKAVEEYIKAMGWIEGIEDNEHLFMRVTVQVQADNEIYGLDFLVGIV